MFMMVLFFEDGGPGWFFLVFPLLALFRLPIWAVQRASESSATDKCCLCVRLWKWHSIGSRISSLGRATALLGTN